MRQPKSSALRFLVKNLRMKLKVKDAPHESDTGNTTKQGSLYDRRKFISDSSKSILAVAVVSSLPGFSSCNSDRDNEKKPIAGDQKQNIHIAIIGGGIAGLNCAYQLQKAGIGATIYEASNRMGGRILTHYNDSMGIGIFPEFGGDFIDSHHEDMLSLAREFNLELIDLEKEKNDLQLRHEVFYFDNRNISEKEIINEFNKIAGKISADIESLGDEYDTEAAISFDNTPLSQYIENLDCTEWLRQLLNASFTAEYGLDCTEQSTLNFLDMINPDTTDGFFVFGDSDERYRIKGGNSKIIESLTKKIDPGQIKKAHLLKALQDTDNNQYELQFENGNSVIADYVVITIPFTILREVSLNLKEMSPLKKQCINELGFGNNTKLVMGYNGSPWRDALNKASGRVCQQNICNGWDGGYTKTENNSNGAFVAYFGGKFSEELSNSSFMNAMTPPSHKWRTELPKETVVKLSKELDHSFKGSHKKFLNKHVFVNWIDYTYTKGSYSCYKTGQWSTIAGQEKLPVGKVLFAGEHCSRNFQGFMNGGAQTGREAAEELKVLIN